MPRTLRVGVDSYSLGPLGLDPFELLDWAKGHGAAGVHFSEVKLKPGHTPDRSFLSDLANAARQRGLYIEGGGGQHIPFDTTSWRPIDLTPIVRAAAEQAHALGATVVRSCSGGLLRWRDESPPTETLLRQTAAALRPLMPMLSDLGVVLAIELHFEFTTFELLRLFELCDAEPGGCLGLCLDTMNLLTMLEDPLTATRRILPWIVAVHAKDGGLRLSDNGLQSFTAGIGSGIVDFERILPLLAPLERNINLSVEDHGGSFDIPIHDSTFLSRFPDLTAGELAQLLKLARASQRRIDEGRMAPLDRGQWPQHCEQRVSAGIVNLKRIAAGLSPTAKRDRPQ